MKNIKRNGKFKKKKGFRALCSLVLIAMVLPFAFLVLVPLLKNKDAEHVILGKLANMEVRSRFTPVAIYRLDGDKAFFAGSGSFFVGSSGEQIITSEHLFRKELGSPKFAFRKLRPLETEITHGLHRILHKGVELSVRPGESPDVVIVQAGDASPIECYSDRTLLGTQERSEITKVREHKVVRSIVSDQSVRIVGVLKSTGDAGTEYVILNYASISGESGTGFVDEDDRLYVLKGIPDWSDKDKAQAEKLLGTNHELAIAYGPFQFRK